MRDFIRSDPFADLESMSLMPESSFAPDISVKDTAEALVLTADVPGVSEDNIEISVTGNRLSISGKREEEREEKEGEQYLAYERSYGNFYRAFVFPETYDLDHVTADLRNGVLHVKIPKKEGTQPKRIKVSGEAGRMVEGTAGAYGAQSGTTAGSATSGTKMAGTEEEEKRKGSESRPSKAA
jgi:HSP20 family protein